MSQGTACRCPRTFFVVVTRNANYSKFNGSRYTPSDYSRVRCQCCGSTWRTKARWVDFAPNMSAIQEAAWTTGKGDTANRGKCPHKREGTT